MTLGKAQTVASAAIGQGFNASARLDSETGEWSVIVSAANFGLNVTTVSTFAIAQTLTPTTQMVKLT